jgi:hypothetical protein
MSKISFVRSVAAFVAAIHITTDLDGDGIPAAPAEWIQLPEGEGSSVTITDLTGVDTTLIAGTGVSSWNVKIKAITAASGAFVFGTGPGPVTGPKGDQGDAGPTGPTATRGFIVNFPTAIPAGTDVPEQILMSNNTGVDFAFGGQPQIVPGSAVIGSDTDWLIFTFLDYDNAGANPVVLSTKTTKVTGGTNGLTANVPNQLSWTVPTIVNGHQLRVKVTHGGAGKILPAGFLLIPG